MDYLLAGITATRLDWTRYRADAVARGVQADLSQAQRTAVSLQANVRVTRLAADRLQVHEDANNNGTVEGGERVTVSVLEHGFTLDQGTMAALPAPAAGSELAAVTFRRDGTASTSGTDSDWVVKLIDVYPQQIGNDPVMSGYQLMVAADILRGRYRESLENPKAITADAPLLYRFALPTANHVFRPGHRIMVQVQSSWFPLYDRNPQTFVASIFWAKPEDYKKATQRVYHAPGKASFVELPVVVE